MVRSSNKKRPELLQAIGQAVQRMQNATDAVDETAAEVLGINRTDLRALSVLQEAGPLSASKLAEATGLTRGAMTTALDRLERAGYARRVKSVEDGRGVVVELTERLAQRAASIWGPLAEEGARLLDKYATSELEVVLRFLEHATALQDSQRRRIAEQHARELRTKR